MNSCHPNHAKKAIAFWQATRILSICSDPATAQCRCNELIEYLVRRGHGWRRTQLELTRAVDAHRNPKQHIREIDSEVYIIVQYHPDLPDIKGTVKNVLPILYTSERMSMCLPAFQLFHSSNHKTILNNYVGPNYKRLRMMSYRLNHAKAIAFSSVPPLFLLTASPEQATVEHYIVLSRLRIAIRRGLCM